jgi:flagellar biosynthesis protein FliQ
VAYSIQAFLSVAVSTATQAFSFGSSAEAVVAVLSALVVSLFVSLLQAYNKMVAEQIVKAIRFI